MLITASLIHRFSMRSNFPEKYDSLECIAEHRVGFALHILQMLVQRILVTRSRHEACVWLLLIRVFVDYASTATYVLDGYANNAIVSSVRASDTRPCLYYVHDLTLHSYSLRSPARAKKTLRKSPSRAFLQQFRYALNCTGFVSETKSGSKAFFAMEDAAQFVNRFPKVDKGELDDDSKSCAICFARYLTGGAFEQPVKIPHCGHIIGNDCLQKWLSTSATCPFCRAEIYSSDNDDWNFFSPRPEAAWAELRIKQLTLYHKLTVTILDDFDPETRCAVDVIGAELRDTRQRQHLLLSLHPTLTAGQSTWMFATGRPRTIQLYRTFRELASSSRNNSEQQVQRWQTLVSEIETERAYLPLADLLMTTRGKLAQWLLSGIDLPTMRNPSHVHLVGRFILDLLKVELGLDRSGGSHQGGSGYIALGMT